MSRLSRNLPRLIFALVFILALGAVLTYTQRAPAVAAQDKASAPRPVVLAHLSDTHIGLRRAPEASANLRRAIEMINQRNPDAVIVTGDVGNGPDSWDEPRQLLSGLKAKVYYVPGNHDNKASNVDRWRKVFGRDYDRFQVRNVTIFALDSQLLGNYDKFESTEVMPLSPEGQAEAAAMLDWFAGEIAAVKAQKGVPGGGTAPRGAHVIVAMQHVPLSRADGFPDDPKPYWTVQEPYRARELELLRRLGVKHMFVGHWHKGLVYEADGITYHVAPATSWSPFGAPLGFAMHTIAPDGDVKTEFVYLP